VFAARHTQGDGVRFWLASLFYSGAATASAAHGAGRQALTGSEMVATD
jgi:hypothetical protein